MTDEGVPHHFERLVVYPFQLRPALWVELRLPASLTPDEADRLCRLIATLVIDPARDGDG